MIEVGIPPRVMSLEGGQAVRYSSVNVYCGQVKKICGIGEVTAKIIEVSIGHLQA